MDIPDKVLRPGGYARHQSQVAERVRQILEEMPPKDRKLLRAIFLEEKGQRCRMPRIRSGSQLPKGLAPTGPKISSRLCM